METSISLLSTSESQPNKNYWRIARRFQHRITPDCQFCGYWRSLHQSIIEECSSLHPGGAHGWCQSPKVVFQKPNAYHTELKTVPLLLVLTVICSLLILEEHQAIERCALLPRSCNKAIYTKWSTWRQIQHIEFLQWCMITWC